jgi:hypothetical protein
VGRCFVLSPTSSIAHCVHLSLAGPLRSSSGPVERYLLDYHCQGFPTWPCYSQLTILRSPGKQDLHSRTAAHVQGAPGCPRTCLALTDLLRRSFSPMEVWGNLLAHSCGLSGFSPCLVSVALGSASSMCLMYAYSFTCMSSFCEGLQPIKGHTTGRRK